MTKRDELARLRAIAEHAATLDNFAFYDEWKEFVETFNPSSCLKLLEALEMYEDCLQFYAKERDHEGVGSGRAAFTTLTEVRALLEVEE